MILSNVDFKNYKNKIDAKFERNFQTVNEFEDFIKEKLGTQNIKSFLSDIIRAENVIKGKDAYSDIKQYTEAELIIKANMSKNRDALLSWKYAPQTVKYLKNIGNDSLDTVIKLQSVFNNDYDVERLNIPAYVAETVTITSSKDIDKNNNFLLYMIIVVVFIVIAPYVLWDSNHPPYGEADKATTKKNTKVLISVLANGKDPDTVDTLSTSKLEQPSHGKCKIVGSDISYRPCSNDYIQDIFYYTPFYGKVYGNKTTAIKNKTKVYRFTTLWLRSSEEDISNADFTKQFKKGK